MGGVSKINIEKDAGDESIHAATQNFEQNWANNGSLVVPNADRNAVTTTSDKITQTTSDSLAEIIIKKEKEGPNYELEAGDEVATDMIDVRVRADWGDCVDYQAKYVAPYTDEQGCHTYMVGAYRLYRYLMEINGFDYQFPVVVLSTWKMAQYEDKNIYSLTDIHKATWNENWYIATAQIYDINDMDAYMAKRIVGKMPLESKKVLIAPPLSGNDKTSFIRILPVPSDTE